MNTGNGPDYGIGAVSRRLGVPAPTLRTWNLRYGLGPSRRSPGGHRRYDSADLWRLEEMNRLIRSGVPAADAARLVLSAHPPPGAGTAQPGTSTEAPTGAPTGASTGASTGVTSRAAPHAPAGAPPAPPRSAAELPAGAPAETRAGIPARARAGIPARARAGIPARARALAPEPRPQIPSPAMLARAAAALDGEAVSEWLGAALERHGVLWTWERLVLPVFARISRRQSDTGAAIEVEHLFSDRLTAALAPLVRRPRDPVNGRPVLLACAQEEQHSLPLHALAAVLTLDHRAETRVLGARTPYPALGDAMRRLGPAVVLVWSQMAATGDPAPLAALPVLRPPALIMAGGPGWRAGLPPAVPHVTSFRDALARITAALHRSPAS
ncbi:MerR family transcriptional regulator [Planomonospora corallina]|uniref:MerR family transcriptional regulator n=1 Tax=Planomonospora corallina TaxID=1806052 RepID=A0ABV8I4T3_9ACTN